MRKVEKKGRAWVVRWDGPGTCPKKNVIGIFNPRASAARMRTLVEALHMTLSAIKSDMLSYARSPRNNPYPATFDQNADGISCEGYISCGHNPYIRASIVRDLVVETDHDGEEHVSWVDIPLPRALV